jgi:DNA-binding XRE family transcriptional regulator
MCTLVEPSGWGCVETHPVAASAATSADVRVAAESRPRPLFGRRLAQLRKQKGWSQERLALESGIARSYLGGVERGQRNIALVNICELAETLGLAPPELLVFAVATPGLG